MIKHTIQSKIQAEANKKTLAEEWGGFWFVAGEVVGKILLGFIGAIADMLVLLSIFYLSTRNWGISLIVSGLLSIIIQLTMGSALMRAVKGFTRKDYERKGFKIMIVLAFLIFIIMLSLTAFLSVNTGSVVEAFTEETLKLEDKDAILSEQDGAIAALTAQYNSDLANLRKEAQTLDQDKVMWEGKWSVRERSSRQAAKIRGEKIPALQANYQKNLDRLMAEKSAIREEVNATNENRTAKHEAKVAKTSGIAIGFNLIFNIVRCFILAAYMVFLVNAANDLPSPAQTPANSVQELENSVRELARQVQTQSILQNQAQEAQEIEQERKRIQPFQLTAKGSAKTASTTGKADSGRKQEISQTRFRSIKEAMRQNYKKAIDPRTKPETRMSNEALCRQRAEVLRMHGCIVNVQFDKKVFEVYPPDTKQL